MERSDDLDSFSKFVRRSGSRLRSTAYLLTGNWGQAEDLVQGALMKTFERRHRIRNPEALESYVRKVMATMFLSSRRLKSAREVSVADFEELNSADPSVELVETMAMWSALSLLSDMQRAVLVLRYYGTASEDEIASMLRCSRGSVKTHASRGLAALRDHLSVEHNPSARPAGQKPRNRS